MRLLKSFRLVVCSLTCFLTFASFRILGLNPPFIALAGSFFIAVSGMLQNDWRDRFHDIKKGKSFAAERPKLFLTVLVAFWSVSFTIVGFAFFRGMLLGISFLFLCAIGFAYSEIRKIPLLPTVLVVFCFSSPIFLPSIIYKEVAIPWFLFLSVFFFVFGREMMKDIDDARIDKGYKWTLAVKMGIKGAQLIAMMSICIGIVIAFSVVVGLPSVKFITIVGFIIICMGLGLFGIGMPSKTARMWLDSGAAVSILGLIIK